MQMARRGYFSTWRPIRSSSAISCSSLRAATRSRRGVWRCDVPNGAEIVGRRASTRYCGPAWEPCERDEDGCFARYEINSSRENRSDQSQGSDTATAPQIEFTNWTFLPNKNAV